MKPGEADGSRRGVACSELQSCRLAFGANQVRLAPGVILARLPRCYEALRFASVAGPVDLVHGRWRRKMGPSMVTALAED
jgi:hypothetical protein